MKVYPRGFVATTKDVRLPEYLDYFVRRSVGSLHFYSDISTPTSVAIKDDFFIILHGHACIVSTEEAVADTQLIANRLADEFARGGTDGIEEQLFWLAGRYVVLAGKVNSDYYVYHDAHGMRTVYVDIQSESISSHVDLLVELFSKSEYAGQRTQAAPLWTAWDDTYVPHIKALVPNHRYSTSDKSFSRYYPVRESKFRDYTEEQRIETVEKLWQNQLDAYVASNKIIMSITGGLDSRVTLALSTKHLDRISGFTYTHDTGISGSSASWRKDKEIVQSILPYIPLKHQIIRYEDRKVFGKADNQIMDRNSIGSHGRWLLGLYPLVFESSNTLHLRSNTHETGRAYYKRKPDDDQIQRVQRMVSGTLASRLGLNDDEKVECSEDALRRLEKFGYRSAEKYIDALDLFYWEFRMGRWVAEVYNETDISFETFTPYNVRSIIELSLGFSYEKRLEGYLFKELINRNMPILNFFGYNDSKNAYEQLKEIGSKPRAKEGNADSSGDQITEIARIKGTQSQLSFSVSCPGTEEKYLVDQLIYIPEDRLIKNGTATYTQSISSDESADLELYNSYGRQAARGYLRHEILINDKLVIAQDIVESTQIEKYRIENQTEADITVSVRIRALRNCQSKSWSNASKTWVNIARFEKKLEAFDEEQSLITVTTNGNRRIYV